MTIRVTRLRREGRQRSVDVYLDEEPVASLAPDASVHLHGTGKPQHLQAKVGTMVSEPTTVTDPGETGWVGVIVSWEGTHMDMRHPSRSHGLRVTGVVSSNSDETPTLS